MVIAGCLSGRIGMGDLGPSLRSRACGGPRLTRPERARAHRSSGTRDLGRYQGPAELVPRLFCRSIENGQQQPTVANNETPGGEGIQRQSARSANACSENTQIYEGTNQIQRVVMARQLLK